MMYVSSIYAAREVTFGEELFQTSRLSFKTIEEICDILKGYKQINGWLWCV